MSTLLDNVFWHCLAGPHACFAQGRGAVRRYAPGFSPILGFEDPRHPDFDELARLCGVGEHFYCDSWTGAPPPGWSVEQQATMFRMVFDARAPQPPEMEGIVALTAAHAQAALELARLTQPGPFGIRTLELGEYFGVFDGDRLVAMAGERTCVPGYREVSGVCTHPAYQGRGHARRLMDVLLARQCARGEIPYLHVMSHNAAAHARYLRMGCRDYREPVVRVLARTL
jgi:ribosomal protein S18 acetylase RimI-like enzyme